MLQQMTSMLQQGRARQQGRPPLVHPQIHPAGFTGHMTSAEEAPAMGVDGSGEGRVDG
jgi:hypothetical protein